MQELNVSVGSSVHAVKAEGRGRGRLGGGGAKQKSLLLVGR